MSHGIPMRVRGPDSGRGLAVLRRQNLSAVLGEVHVGGPRSRSGLAARRSGVGAGTPGRDAVDRLLGAAEAGDAAAIDAIREVGRWLGIGIAGLVDIFNPGGVALGGLYARLYPYVRDEIVESIAHRAIAASRDLVDVTSTVLGDDSALLGAAELAFAPILRDPTLVAPAVRAVPAA